MFTYVGMRPRKSVQSLALVQLNLGPPESCRSKKMIVPPVVERSKHDGKELVPTLTSQKRSKMNVAENLVDLLRELKEPSPSTALEHISLGGANILRMFRQGSFLVLNNVDSIYTKLKKVKRTSLAQINEMEVELNVSKVQFAEQVKATMAKAMEIEGEEGQAYHSVGMIVSLITSLWERNPDTDFSFLLDRYLAELEKFKLEVSGDVAPTNEVVEFAPSPKETHISSSQS
ncbi:hypothetical protein Pint_22505 [Pistacia integerrima]|uniref:Uncharacterized protein n=1 Tax=Pistacia integerrima TaxID=434235 RepID=A0ACC0YMH1_9ROSI|nr:hypothetical protein Pint_22505 [Pistacia integerrima]